LFFSSRRRHTRSKRDWSSDVCSSDLIELLSQWHDGTSQMVYFRLQPLTGRKHQLRVHMRSLGAPIVNDRWYALNESNAASVESDCAAQNDSTQTTDFKDPLQLLARSIAFIDPISRDYREFRSERTLQWLPARPNSA